jgi:hypothetical protein
MSITSITESEIKELMNDPEFMKTVISHLQKKQKEKKKNEKRRVSKFSSLYKDNRAFLDTKVLPFLNRDQTSTVKDNLATEFLGEKSGLCLTGYGGDGEFNISVSYDDKNELVNITIESQWIDKENIGDEYYLGTINITENKDLLVSDYCFYSNSAKDFKTLLDYDEITKQKLDLRKGDFLSISNEHNIVCGIVIPNINFTKCNIYGYYNKDIHSQTVIVFSTNKISKTKKIGSIAVDTGCVTIVPTEYVSP